MEIFERSKDDVILSTDKSLLDLELIHTFLSQSYWSPGIPKETVQSGIQNSLSVGLFKANRQIGFCRLITDYTSFAYLADVFVIEKERSHGYAKWMIETLKEIPSLKGLRRWLLATKDAHKLYQSVGWNQLENPEYFMEIVKKNIYKISDSN